jgi:hypothetical protein
MKFYKIATLALVLTTACRLRAPAVSGIPRHRRRTRRIR